MLSREAYSAVERKVLNRMKSMALEGQINLIETNDRMFGTAGEGAIPQDPNAVGQDRTQTATGPGQIRKVAGW